MSTYAKISRLGKIVSLIEHKPGISLAEIQEGLSHYEESKPISKRTLERDLATIRSEFFIQAEYNNALQGYKIDDSALDETYEFLKLVEFASVGKLLKDGKTDLSKFSDLVELDDSSIFTGIHLVKKIITAILQQQHIRFKHINYWENTEKDYTITPLRIKEYLNRWYVIGVPHKSKEIRTFGIDRLKDLDTAGASMIKYKDYEEQLNRFHKIIGLNFNEGDGKTKRIKLRVFHKHLKYLQSLPLHRSQQIDWQRGQEHGIVTYRIVPNYEFKIQILKMHCFAEVLEPSELREEIKSMLQEALDQY
ncbi:helix-turn-helix transcriptional regulator [Leeuwenhoekiella polynyae]|uniref:Putative DNA-binding transcriptional regulator YafY n=1 Tax=Leeuwenhoekiella polynyae TaxID=1550906 RepID=A0A4Q0PGQ0_9FLAO|nr:WYL domain-containing protein [Leeuwenhoekiella polynyae]RXG26043.1 putative DNA-binding transcriptional regulator YafY [Leeuwenhoekiella polynyae]